MEKQQEQLISRLNNVWDTLAEGRERWHDFMMTFLKPVGDEIIRSLQLTDNDTVLDLATGTGEPGLTIAGIVSHGKVVGADFSPDMLRIAQVKAHQKGVSNFYTMHCEAGNLPFPDHTFDAVSCRNGYMFFPDLAAATRELYRVLKPQCRIAVSVWGACEKNAWVTAPMQAITAHPEAPAAAHATLSLFRCAQTRMIADLFAEAGFRRVSEKAVSGKVNYASKEMYWQFITQVTAPVALAINELSGPAQLEVKARLFEWIGEMTMAGSIVFDYESLVITGEK